MEGEIITKAAGTFTFGALFVYIGLTGWKDRHKERIKVIEAAISKRGGKQPSPPHSWDRVMAYIQPILMLIFGPCMILIAISMLTKLGD